MANDFTLLLVEPNANQQSSITEVLRNDFNIEQIITAESSKQALHYLTDDTSVDCILVNSELGESSGFTLISDIKSIERYTGTAVLIMSEQKDRTHLLQAAACGASDFIIKPFTPRSLSLKLKKLISGQEFRVNKRVSTFGAFQTEINFGEQRVYQAKLVDISISGCSLVSELFHNGGCVYDIADIKFNLSNEPFTLSAELIRVERDPESEDSQEKEIMTAFQFRELSETQQKSVQHFITELNNY